MGLVSDSKGAKIIDLEKYKMGKTIVRKAGDWFYRLFPSCHFLILDLFADGTSIYLTRDIGAAIERYEKFKFDKMIYVIANQQDLHVAQFFKVLTPLHHFIIHSHSLLFHPGSAADGIPLGRPTRTCQLWYGQGYEYS